ncbi:hypothetical protein KFL_003630020 [Klebsormidium nitens]|uniref:Uncharacterized protein n=1 Tax=Klebsormidium nitens TaxID=105231 RepID=A0A1Y1IFQ2_KLENI|nr:hypothetical protein KFL_003630020 [Klebsormidium nitens]|eukprot:GAQ87586.1 hypothetical protein KFL_003630020 [Klebsormidium nitens]
MIFTASLAPTTSLSAAAPDRRCAANESACSCQSHTECPSGYCCTGDYGKVITGHCTDSPFDSSGAQVCPDCYYYNGISCPAAKRSCCSVTGACVDDVAACPCYYSQYYCPSGCCTVYDYNYNSIGHCSATGFFSNGTQECPNCNDFRNGISCPANKKVCCPNGQCAASSAACTCQGSSFCPVGYCCTEDYSGRLGKCTSAPFNSNGKQVCPNCNNWNGANNGVYSPADKGTCCSSGECVASQTSCPS